MEEYIYSLPPPPPGRKLNRHITGDQENPVKKAKVESDDLVALSSSDQALVETMRKATENIDDWISQRKKNWPSNKRIHEKQQIAKQQNSESGKYQDSSSSKLSRKPQQQCRYFAAWGSCRLGQKCNFSHERVYKRYEAPDRSSLFRRLVQSDRQDENERILSYIEKLNERGYLNDPSQSDPTVL